MASITIGQRRPAPARTGAPMVPVRTVTRTTYTRGTPDGPSRKEVWEAHSLDGAWSFHRQEDEGTTWTVVFVPTGQEHDFFSTLAAGRRAVASGWLLDHFRAEALRAAVDTGAPVVRRAAGQRWLAGHLRLAGKHTPEARCTCGGYLGVVQRAGVDMWTHLDVCGRCWSLGAGLVTPCPVPEGHGACADPTVG